MIFKFKEFLSKEKKSHTHGKRNTVNMRKVSHSILKIGIEL